MTKQCRSCKREIAKGQSICYICGSQQSFIRHHITNILLTFSLIGTVSAASYWYIDQSAKQADLDRLRLIESINAEFAKKTQSLQLQLEQANQKIELAKTHAAQASNASTDINLKTEATEKRAKKAEERATWLSKENRRFKAKIKELNNKISDIQKASQTNQQQTSQPPSVSGTGLVPAGIKPPEQEAVKSEPQNDAVVEGSQLDTSPQQTSNDKPTPLNPE